MRQFEKTDLLLEGAGERTFLMAKEFALQECGRDRGAIQKDEGPLPPAAEVMNGARHQFLARAGLALDEDGCVGRGHELDSVYNSL